VRRPPSLPHLNLSPYQTKTLTQTPPYSWSLIFHWILAITNSCNYLRYVTRFPCDIFGFYVAFIYLQKGIQVLERLGSAEPFYLSVVTALLVFMAAYLCGELGTSSLFHHHVRVFFKDYGTPLTLIFFTGFVHIGRMKDVHLEVLPTGIAFKPTAEREWVVRFWELGAGDVFLAVPFAVLLTILFWFDHNGENPAAATSLVSRLPLH
jgi:boron transporter